MSYRADRAQRLDRLMDQLGAADFPSVEMFSSVGRECDRVSASRFAAVRIDALVSAGAWIDAALLLMEAALPLWKLRRLAYDDGRWHCAVSRQRELPDWLDLALEADHQNLPIAILTVVVATLLEHLASREVSVPAVPIIDQRYETLDCGNFA